MISQYVRNLIEAQRRIGQMDWPELAYLSYAAIVREHGRQGLNVHHIKPAVRVLPIGQHRRLYVLKVGRRFVAAYTWKKLAQKVVMHQWAKFQGSVYAKRWR